MRIFRAQPLPKPAPPPDPSASTLVAALQSAAAGLEESRARLEETVCHYVASLKAEDLLVEQVLVRVKQAIDHAGLRKDGTSVEMMIDHVIRLCIREYYRSPM